MLNGAMSQFKEKAHCNETFCEYEKHGARPIEGTFVVVVVVVALNARPQGTFVLKINIVALSMT